MAASSYLTVVRAIPFWLASLTAILFPPFGFAQASSAAGPDHEQIETLLTDYCYSCHGDGGDEGNLKLDELLASDDRMNDREAWWSVLKNVRADIMPPADEPHPTADEKQALADWIKARVFALDPQHPDPGRVTLRRLNRIEYRNTIVDLMGIEFDTEAEFPPDDTGYGFDNNSDVLSISPLLLEKYLEAARVIVDQAVPTVTKTIPKISFDGEDFRGDDARGERMSLYEAASVSRQFHLEHEADYRVRVNVAVNGGFDFDPGRCEVAFVIDDEPRLEHAYKWQSKKEYEYEFVTRFSAGEHEMSFLLKPLTPESEKKSGISFRIETVQIEGPLDKSFWKHPKGYEGFFHRDEPPEDQASEREYCREVLQRFATRAFRRPVDQDRLDLLVEITQIVQQQPDRSFEEGVAKAMMAVLSSPRFLFRIENVLDDGSGRFPLIDEYALASRLSYLFWSTMPDDELIELARRGQLRANLDGQVRRLLRDERSSSMIVNFVGQWLQSRNVESVSIDPLAAAGLREEYDELREVLTSKDGRRREPGPDDPSYLHSAWQRRSELRSFRDSVDQQLRADMRRETEMLFEYIVRQDRSVLELIDADYTFLSERLAKHYGIDGVAGEEMRKVTLPADDPRGGVLTQGTFLMVTSNPTRTSPVKRGLFILDNILGTPAPPPPANVPELEAAKPALGATEPTLRELLEAHRSEALCNSCHERFDPLGLALENFNAIGLWRETEHGRAIDPSGQLITGESFADITELKGILRGSRRHDFYRCLAERFLTYALGRGLEYYDEQTLDDLVTQLNEKEGRFSALLEGVVHSASFQRQRPIAPAEQPPQTTGSPQ
jgi:hypothetical protein